MTHPDRDQDLLLFVHGALPPVGAALTRWHLARCPDCRRRAQQHRAVSHGLAGAVRGGDLPRWSLPVAGAALRVTTAWLLAGAVLLVVLLGTLAVHQRQTVRRAPVGSAPCRPDLPSDRCR